MEKFMGLWPPIQNSELNTRLTPSLMRLFFIIDKDLRDFLLVEHPVIPVIYCLLKIHKSLINLLIRLIISGQGSILRTYDLFTVLYIRNTAHFLKAHRT